MHTREHAVLGSVAVPRGINGPDPVRGPQAAEFTAVPIPVPEEGSGLRVMIRRYRGGGCGGGATQRLSALSCGSGWKGVERRFRAKYPEPALDSLLPRNEYWYSFSFCTWEIRKKINRFCTKKLFFFLASTCPKGFKNAIKLQTPPPPLLTSRVSPLSSA